MSREHGFTCFCIGLGMGATAAILWTPRSGEETRKQIKKTADDGADFLKEQAETAADKATEVVDRGKRTARHYKENVMAAMEAGKQSYRDAVAATPDSDYKL
jgi:gas vesicle protein